jgi:hypothetical protein
LVTVVATFADAFALKFANATETFTNNSKMWDFILNGVYTIDHAVTMLFTLVRAKILTKAVFIFGKYYQPKCMQCLFLSWICV